jgi:hypothetical protein
VDYRYSLQESLHNQIECIWEDDYPSHIVYQGKKYIFVGTTNHFRVDTYNVEGACLSYDDVMLSWNGYRHMGYIDEYYSYSSDDPMYIYNAYYVYFSEDYNYLTDTFVVDDTNEEIVFEEAFYPEYMDLYTYEGIDIDLISKTHSRIKIRVKLICVNDQWYIFLHDPDEVWRCSDEFIKIIYQNGLL